MTELKKAIIYASQNDQAVSCVLLAEHWLQNHPDDQWVTKIYAEMLYLLTRYDEAVQVYLEAIEKFPENCSIFYSGLGSLNRYRGHFTEAETWFRKATEADPNDATYLIFLGSIQARQGNLQAAEGSHRQATKCTSGCIDEAFHNLGLVLRAQGYLEDAADCFRAAIEIDSEYENAIEALNDVSRAIKLLGNEKD